MKRRDPVVDADYFNMTVQWREPGDEAMDFGRRMQQIAPGETDWQKFAEDYLEYSAGKITADEFAARHVGYRVELLQK